VHVNRVKDGKSSVHPLRGDEIPALRTLQKATQGPFVFETERGGPFTRNAVNKQLRNIARRAGFADNQVHFRMLRHGCGCALANAGHDTRAIQDWMGHKNIQHTARYTEPAPTRFRDLWR
jgi:integrase